MARKTRSGFGKTVGSFQVRQGSGEKRVVLLRNILIQVLSEAASCCIKTEDDAGHQPKRVSQWKHKPPARFSHRSCDAVCNSLTLPVNGTSRDTSVPVGHAQMPWQGSVVDGGSWLSAAFFQITRRQKRVLY